MSRGAFWQNDSRFPGEFLNKFIKCFRRCRVSLIPTHRPATGWNRTSVLGIGWPRRYPLHQATTYTGGIFGAFDSVNVLHNKKNLFDQKRKSCKGNSHCNFGDFGQKIFFIFFNFFY